MFWQKLHAGHQWVNAKTPLWLKKRLVTNFNRPVKKLAYWLSKQEQTQLRLELEAFIANNQKFSGQSFSTQQGALSSRALGAGFEYAESQPYQTGDDIRFLDWRLMAKNQQPFTKWFEPERLETWCVLADFNESMQFGTRKRLKIQQACRVIATLSYIVEQRQAQIQLIKRTRYAEQSGFALSPLWQGRAFYEQVLEFINPVDCALKTQQSSPTCQSNQSNNAAQASWQNPSLSELLLAVPDQLIRGAKLVIVSDFHGLDPQDTQLQNRLSYLAERFSLNVVFIEDWAERYLPNNQALQLENLAGGSVVNLNAQQLHAYQVWAQESLNQQQKFLQACGANLVVCRADESIADFLPKLRLSIGV